MLSVGVACSLKGPPSEQIIKLLGTMYRLLKSATLLTKAPQSGSPPAFHTLTQLWACHLACLPFTLLCAPGCRFRRMPFRSLNRVTFSFLFFSFHTLLRCRAYLLAFLHCTLAYNTGHVMWHVCSSHVVNLAVPLGASYAALQTLVWHASAFQLRQSDMYSICLLCNN